MSAFFEGILFAEPLEVMGGAAPDGFQSVNTCPRFRNSQDSGYLLNMAYRVMGLQAGFGLIESSFTRKMNCVNIMAKNIVDFAKV